MHLKPANIITFQFHTIGLAQKVSNNPFGYTESIKPFLPRHHPFFLIFATNSTHYETRRSIKHQERPAEAHPTAGTAHTEQRESAGRRRAFGRAHGADEGTRRLPHTVGRPHLAHQRHQHANQERRGRHPHPTHGPQGRADHARRQPAQHLRDRLGGTRPLLTLGDQDGDRGRRESHRQTGGRMLRPAAPTRHGDPSAELPDRAGLNLRASAFIGRTGTPTMTVARSRQHPFTMNRTAQAQHVVIRMHGLGRTAHYLPVDCECRMPFCFKTPPIPSSQWESAARHPKRSAQE